MTQQHPIKPPPELLRHWLAEHRGDGASISIAVCAAQWGADYELEACLNEVSFLNSRALADRVREKRRPKPPSLKQQARQALFRFDANAHINADEMQDDFDLIRRALEQLND
jgi:hypothetical protein